MKTSMGVFGARKEVFCAKESGCYPMGYEVFSAILRGGKDK